MWFVFFFFFNPIDLVTFYVQRALRGLFLFSPEISRACIVSGRNTETENSYITIA